MNHLDDVTLNEYLDQALDEAAHAEAESHLQVCADCRARLGDLRMLFTSLGELPTTTLEHDLAPDVLAHLSRENPITTWTWTRALATQLGVVAGFILWLGMQIVPLIRVPQLTLPKLPVIDAQSLVMRLLSVKLPIHEFSFPVFDYRIPLVDFQLPTFNIPFSSHQIAILAISTVLLWAVGNVILLKGRQEVES